MYIVSECLLGHNCKYNGGNNLSEAVIDFCRNKNICAVCPETAGGLQSPRPPAEYTEDGRILDSKGKDVTEAFELGAQLSLEKALKKAAELGEDIEGAVLKANSPSCGTGRIYDGTFSGRLKAGDGCFVRKLKARNIKVISEKEITNGKF